MQIRNLLIISSPALHKVCMIISYIFMQDKSSLFLLPHQHLFSSLWMWATFGPAIYTSTANQTISHWFRPLELINSLEAFITSQKIQTVKNTPALLQPFLGPRCCCKIRVGDEPHYGRICERIPDSHILHDLSLAHLRWLE